jgi:hypothetical protein
MAEINAKTLPGDDRTFLPDEIREAAGYAPASEVEGWDENAREPEDGRSERDDPDEEPEDV